MIDHILVRGARQHNLKNIDVDIPKNKLVVITGVSGSGKSSLAIDTLYAEGQRRYVESLSAYARQFLELMEKPDVDSIEYLSPSICIEQKTISSNPRSTVGTVTEIYDYFRLLYARVGDVFCPSCGKLIQKYSVQQIVDNILKFPIGSKIEILAPIVRGKKGEYKQLFKKLLKDGFVRGYVDGELVRFEDEIELNKNVKHDISVVVDRIKIKEDIKRRVTDSVEVALRLAEGLVKVRNEENETLYSEHFSCPDCNVSFAEIEPRIFSFNNPYGACPVCDGIGEKMIFDIDLIVPDKDKSIREGAIKPWEKLDDFYFYNTLIALSEKYKIDLNKPFKKLTDDEKKIILYGVDEPLELFTFKGEKKVFYKKKFDGVIGYLKERLYSGIKSDVDFVKQFMSEMPCETCNGTRLKKESLSIKVGGKNIAEISSMTIEELHDFVSKLKFEGFKASVADKILREIKRRLKFLLDVGLDYITLDRKAGTLSGGESQRIRLATQIGAGLTGVLYVLDEPSIGLHQRDNGRLISTLKGLRDIGNTVLVVEHDEDTIKEADWVIDMGPYAGRKGGEVVFSGTPEELMKAENSLTGSYLSGRLKIEVPEKRRKGNGKSLKIIGAKRHNLKNIDIEIPLGKIVCITGVSGSGKSSLVIDVLYDSILRKLRGQNVRKENCEDLVGIENIDKVIDIDQSPIGRTPRSNPATYTGVFTDIREIFALTVDAKKRGYKMGRFSFNVKGGRCENCQGEGYIKIEMHFLPDMYVKCDVCHGLRYNRDTLDIRYKGKNIAEVLDMTVNQAYEFFENIPKLKNKLEILRDVGLGYIKLGQPATTLSGGEAQRIKLAKELMKRMTGKTLYLFDEPTTGLHMDDIKKLINIFYRLVDNGNSVIIIEHNLDVIKCADYIIDLGPEGGDRGGRIVFQGTPEECCLCEESYTGKYLSEKLYVQK
ncbi:excinuclease ABC subunit UvrA [Deferribacter autotrophicus]|uniref:UvrABC system protein A n=1 Tax=Deferribacter autotrophicus TaxID=500465 RepID=A0A5A8F554_9BACT|nr:excinuclease ABC subunit UvrA [Deferribacter autotrophicus]